MTDGVLTADRLEVINDGEIIVFDGRVQLMMAPKSGPS